MKQHETLHINSLHVTLVNDFFLQLSFYVNQLLKHTQCSILKSHWVKIRSGI